MRNECGVGREVGSDAFEKGHVGSFPLLQESGALQSKIAGRARCSAVLSDWVFKIFS